MITRRKRRLRPTRWLVASIAAIGVVLLHAVANVGLAAEEPRKASVVPAYQPARPYWPELTHEQRDALAPLADDWERLDLQTKRKWVEIANRYPRMKPDEQARTRDRMREWASLTPEQRRVARDSYARIRAMPPEERAEMLRKYQELSPEAREKLEHQGRAAKSLVVPRPQGAVLSPRRHELREGTKVGNPAIAAQKSESPVAATRPPVAKGAAAPLPAAVKPDAAAPDGAAPVAPVPAPSPAAAPPTSVAPAARPPGAVMASTALPSSSDAQHAGTPVPSLRRRFMSMTYESVLLFAVVFIGDYLFDTLTQSRDGLVLRNVRQAWLFALLGLYFVWFWVHGGQTLAMKTWHVRLEGRGGALGYGRAVARYVLLWIFVLPTLAIAYGVGLPRWETFVALAAAIAIPPFYARFDRDRQFLHDRLLGTRLVSV